MLKPKRLIFFLAAFLLLAGILAGCSVAEIEILSLDALTLSVENQNHVSAGTYSVEFDIPNFEKYLEQHKISVSYTVIDENGAVVPITSGSFEVANDKNYRVTITVSAKEGTVLKRATYTVSASLTDEISSGDIAVSSAEHFIFSLNNDGESYVITGFNYGIPEKIVLPYVFNNLPVTAIGNSAFLNAGIKSIILNKNILSIGNNAFKGCKYLDRISISDSVTSIGDFAFSGCSSLSGAEISLDSALVSIGKRAFENCSRFSNICLPKGLETLGEMAFYGCVNLSSVVFGFTDPEVIQGKGIFTENVYTYVDPSEPDGIKTTYLFGVECKIYVNNDALSAFSNHSKWKKYTEANMFEAMNLVAGKYVLRSIGTELEIVAYLGNDSEIIIPRTLELKKVVGIADGVFRRYQTLKTLTLQKELRYIGASAFENCSSLEKIIIENDSYLNSIGASAFYNCTNLTTLSVPETVTHIGQDAFVGTKWLNNSKEEFVIVNKVLLKYNGIRDVINLSENSEIQEIAPYAFYNNLALTRLELPSTVESIGANAFFGCNNLKVLVAPTTVFNPNNAVRWSFYGAERVERIEINAGAVLQQNAFANAKSLVSVTFREGNYLNTIQSHAFLNMSGLTNIIIPESVTGIASDAFEGCSALTSATLSSRLIVEGAPTGEWTFYGTDAVLTLNISSGTNIADYAFCGAKKLNSVIVPATVTYIGTDAFKSQSIFSVSLASSLLYENNPLAWNLYGNTVLKKVTVTSGTNIPANSFGGSLVEIVELPETLTSIGENAFYNTSKLNSVTVKEGTNFLSENGVLFNFDKTRLFVFPTENAVKGAFTEYTIPLSVTSVEANAFYGENTLTKLTVPFILVENNTFAPAAWSFYGGAGALTEIQVVSQNAVPVTLKAGAFNNAAALTSISLPENVSAIGENAFLGCIALNKIVAPSEVFFTNAEAVWKFYGAENITLIEISSGTAVAQSAFANAALITSVKLAGTITTVGDNAFAGCTALSHITAPVSLLSANTAPNWNFYGKTGLSSFTAIAGGAASEIGRDFFNASTLTSITVGKDILSVADGAFRECGSLTSISVEAGNTAFKSIGGVLYSLDATTLYAYPQAKAGTSLVVDESVSTILSEAFYHQNNLTSITLPTSALWDNSSNSGWHFFGANNISQLTVNGGNLLNSPMAGAIPDYAFANGINLRKIVLTSTIRTIGNGVFVNCPNLEVELRNNNSFRMEEGVLYNSTGSILICYPSSLTSTEYSVSADTASIRAGAFSMVTHLKKIVVGANLIPANAGGGDWSFYGCGSLTDIIIEGGGISIPENAFRNSRTLQYVSLGETVTRVDANAFYGATNLTRIGCNAGLLSSNLGMESWNFYGAANITHLDIVGGSTLIDYCLYNSEIWEISIGSTVTDIQLNAFENAKGLQRISVSALNTVYCSSDDGVLYNKNKSMLIKYPAANVTDTSGSKFSIPLSVSSIRSNAFKGSALLRAIKTPISVMFDNYGNANWIFYGAEDLINVTILNGGTIPAGARYFYNATKLTGVVLSTISTIFEQDLFRGCSILNSVSVSSSLLFNNENNPNWIFYGATSVREVNVISGTSVVDRAFNNAVNLNKISLCSTVQNVGANTFTGCNALETVSAPAVLLKNQSQAASWDFYGTNRVKNFTVNSGTIIPAGAFAKAVYLEKIVFADSVTTINALAFTETTALQSIGFSSNAYNDLEGNSFTYNDNYATMNGVLFNKTGVNIVLANPTETDETKKDYRYIPLFDSLLAYPANRTGTRYDIPNSILSIASGAFNSAQKLTVIKLGQNVGTIGAEAFKGCISLASFESASIKFTVGNTAVDSGILFGTDKKELVAYPMARPGNTLLLAAVDAQDISLSAQNFYSGSDNTLVTTTYIRKNALYGANITDLYLSTSVLFDNSANQGWNFYGATGIKRVYIADGTAIPAKAFYSASNLEQIYLGYRINSIGLDAFVGALPKDATGLIHYGFKSVYKFVTTNEIYGNYTVDDIGILFKVETNSLVTGTGNYKTLVAYPAYSATNTLDLSQSKYKYLSSVEKSAFFGAANLTTLLIPDGMLSERAAQESWDFYGATGITHITIKKYDSTDTTTLPLRAFYNASKLQYVKFETFVERSSNMDTAFYGCTSLASLVFDFVSGKTAVYTVDAGVLYESGGTGGAITKYRLVMYMPSNPQSSFIIPSTVKEIATYAFYAAASLNDITIPNPKDLLYSNATNLNWNYKGSTFITSVTVIKGGASASDAYIPAEAFMNATRLTKVTIDNTVVSINQNAFYNTPNLTWLTTHIALLSTSLEMGWNFYGATTVSKLTLTPSVGQTGIGANTVDGYVVGNNITITEVEISEGITTIGDYTFFGAKRLASISLPTSLVEIGNNAFVETVLSDIDLSHTALSTIGVAAFEGNSTITKVILPDTIRTIEERAFSSMSGLNYVLLPDGLLTIGNQAFKGCIGLNSVAIPKTVSTLGESAFYGCIEAVVYFADSALPATLGTDWSFNTLGYVLNASVFYYQVDNINTEVYAYSNGTSINTAVLGTNVWYTNDYPSANIPVVPLKDGYSGEWYYDNAGVPTSFGGANTANKEYLLIYVKWTLI